MQYIDYLTKQPSDKDAIIINGDRYTYGKLYVLVQDARARLPQVAEKHLYPIRETGILKQLVLFLACAGIRSSFLTSVGRLSKSSFK